MTTPSATPDAPEPSPSQGTSWGVVSLLVVLLLVAAHVTLGVMSTSRLSATFDEPAHTVSGEVYWRYNDYRFQPENGNLPQRWCALGNYLFRSVPVTKPTDVEWERSDVWTLVGKKLASDGDDLGDRLALARLFSVFWGASICVLVYWTSQKIFGPESGLLSLALCAFCPTLLANGPLATSDACAAFFFLAATLSTWELLHRVDLTRWCLTTLAVAGLCLAKYSAPLILPIAAILTIVRLIAGYPTGIGLFGVARTFSSRAIAALLAAGNVLTIGVASWAILWTAYGWRYETINPHLSSPGEMYVGGSLEQLLPHVPSRRVAAAISMVAERELLPEAYCYGATHVLAKQERDSFFNGEYSYKGWLAFFPYCFAVKTSPLLLAVLLLSALGWIVRRRSSNAPSPANKSQGGFDRGTFYACIPLITLLCVYWLSALSTTLNIGHRHILPTYPPLYVLAGGALAWISNKTLARGLLAAATIVAATIAMTAFPHYLAYFNGIVTRDEGYRHLVDSSLDWGQDLPTLRDWLKANNPSAEDGGSQRVFLDYFGIDSPKRFDIESEPVMSGCQNSRIAPGLYCFSATELQAVYAPNEQQWTPVMQQSFNTMRELAKAGFANTPRGTQINGQLVDGKILSELYPAVLRFRLRTILRSKKPLANVGGSILVFDVTPEFAASVVDDE